MAPHVQAEDQMKPPLMLLLAALPAPVCGSRAAKKRYQEMGTGTRGKRQTSAPLAAKPRTQPQLDRAQTRQIYTKLWSLISCRDAVRLINHLIDPSLLAACQGIEVPW